MQMKHIRIFLLATYSHEANIFDRIFLKNLRKDVGSTVTVTELSSFPPFSAFTVAENPERDFLMSQL